MKFIKSSIFILSILLLSYVFFMSFNDIKSSILFKREFLIIEVFLLSIIYAVLLIFVALSWKNILDLLTKETLPFSLVWVWLRANIYRYLPGNIFNYVNRQLVSKRMGVSHKVLLQSNVIEAILIISTSIIISSSILLFIYDFTINDYFTFLDKTYIYIGLVLFIGVLFYFYKYKNIKIFDYWQSMLLYTMFFFGIGLSAYYILNYQMNIEFSFLLITAIYTFAWLVGFITPGAPGGIGVRESVFIFLSNGSLLEADAIVLSAMLRFVSLIGEIILFMIASKILNEMEELK